MQFISKYNRKNHKKINRQPTESKRHQAFTEKTAPWNSPGISLKERGRAILRRELFLKMKTN